MTRLSLRGAARTLLDATKLAKPIPLKRPAPVGDVTAPRRAGLTQVVPSCAPNRASLLASHNPSVVTASPRRGGGAGAPLRPLPAAHDNVAYRRPVPPSGSVAIRSLRTSSVTG